MGFGKHHYEQSGGDGNPAELFQIVKDDAVKVLQGEKGMKEAYSLSWQETVILLILSSSDSACSITASALQAEPHTERLSAAHF